MAIQKGKKLVTEKVNKNSEENNDGHQLDSHTHPESVWCLPIIEEVVTKILSCTHKLTVLPSIEMYVNVSRCVSSSIR